MKLIKRGRIFDPRNHKLPAGCLEFAKSPQALVFDDFVRIYFSTASAERETGKLVSHVAYADMTRDLRRILGVSEHVVIARGELGCFDEHGIFPFSVFRHGNRIVAYTTGWSRRVSVSVETGIGIAESLDGGATFHRVGVGPVLSASLHEPFLVCDGFVKAFGDTFHMWYIFGTSWRRKSCDSPPDRTYKIGHATSADGVKWTKDEGVAIIPDVIGPDECQALPTVVALGGRYHMFFCYRDSFDFRSPAGRGYRLGHAWSDDLKNWTRDDDGARLHGGQGDWDDQMQCYPNVFECDGDYFLLYNGNEFGRFGFGVAEIKA